MFKKYLCLCVALSLILGITGCSQKEGKKPVETRTLIASDIKFFANGIDVPDEVITAFQDVASNYSDTRGWKLITNKRNEQVQEDKERLGEFVYIFRGTTLDDRKVFKSKKGGDSYESHYRVISIKACPHKVVAIQTEKFDSDAKNERGEKIYSDILKESDSKYASKVDGEHRACIHNGKVVEFKDKL